MSRAPEQMETRLLASKKEGEKKRYPQILELVSGRRRGEGGGGSGVTEASGSPETEDGFFFFLFLFFVKRKSRF